MNDNARLELVKLQGLLLQAIDKKEYEKAKVFKKSINQHLKLHYQV